MQDECEGRVQVYSGAGHVLSCEAAAHGAVAGLGSGSLCPDGVGRDQRASNRRA